jgi:crotonobetainyl-CoA:carnitine CoA-transferase CaiB-like acyl-CoA transferase
LHRRGLGADDVTARAGRVWARITGHGAGGECATWTGFGDDAAVAGGLVGRSSDGPVFCGDAIADPLTGMHAALAVAESLARGGGEIIDVAMAAVAATYAALPETRGGGDCPALVPAAPDPHPRASDLGADHRLVERLIAERRMTTC